MKGSIVSWEVIGWRLLTASTRNVLFSKHKIHDFAWVRLCCQLANSQRLVWFTNMFLPLILEFWNVFYKRRKPAQSSPCSRGRFSGESFLYIWWTILTNLRTNKTPRPLTCDLVTESLEMSCWTSPPARRAPVCRSWLGRLDRDLAVVGFVFSSICLVGFICKLIKHPEMFGVLFRCLSSSFSKQEISLEKRLWIGLKDQPLRPCTIRFWKNSVSFTKDPGKHANDFANDFPRYWPLMASWISYAFATWPLKMP